MRELYLPKPEQQPDLTEVYDSVIHRLPLQDCRTERHELSGRLEFIAPPSKMFTISGEFEIWREASDGHYLGNPPTLSRALHAKIRAKQGHDFGFDVLLDGYKPPSSFSGRRLSISVNHIRLGETVPPRFDLNVQKIKVHIVGPIDAEAEDGVAEYSWEETTGSEIFHPGFYDKPLAHVFWYYDEAEGDLRSSRVQLVPDTLPRPELKVVQDSNSKGEIWTPLRTDSESYFSFIEDRLSGVSFDPAAKLRVMRARRLQGLPFSDDPLRYLKIVQANKDGQTPGLAWLANDLENLRKNGPKNYADAERMRSEQLSERYRQERAEKLRGSLAIITDAGPIYKIVSENAQPDWLNRELDQHQDIEF